MEYREHRPAPGLRAFVACYWSLRGVAGAESSHRVLPDGCVDLLFDLSGHGHEDAPHARVIGVMSTAIVAEPVAAEGKIDLLGVRFRSGEAAAFLSVAARDIRDRALGLREVCGHWGRELAERLHEIDMNSRIALLDEALLGRPRRHAPDRRLRAAIDAIDRGETNTAALATRVGLGNRQLLRLFDEHVGLGPKALARVRRVQSLVVTLDVLDPVQPPRWAELAVVHGFADQSHLIRDVRALTGATPTELWTERRRGLLGASESSNPPAAVDANVEA